MAFKLTQKPTFTARVKVDTPNDKGGFDRSEFTATFKRVNMDELDDLRNLPQRDVQRKVLVGWGNDLIDDAGQAVDYNDDTLAALLNIPPALAALTEAFWSSIFKAREKN